MASNRLNILLDTNVIIDAVLERNSNNKNALKILTKCIEKKINGFVTSHSLCDFFYITRKDISLELRKKILILISSNLTILIESNDEFQIALNKDFFFDIEDGLQMQCAESACLDYIVTENTKDFSNSIIPAIPVTDCAEKI